MLHKTNYPQEVRKLKIHPSFEYFRLCMITFLNQVKHLLEPLPLVAESINNAH